MSADVRVLPCLYAGCDITCNPWTHLDRGKIMILTAESNIRQAVLVSRTATRPSQGKWPPLHDEIRCIQIETRSSPHAPKKLEAEGGRRRASPAGHEPHRRSGRGQS
ncbi:hypothetical protein C8Q70DRAFT_548226 [Cubamyces menziesii]|nr:hypothetical protein C8Q70DRAFT_548226 [Cubamyces menziesii]